MQNDYQKIDGILRILVSELLYKGLLIKMWAGCKGTTKDNLRPQLDVTRGEGSYRNPEGENHTE